MTSVQPAPKAPGALFLIPLSGGEKRRLTSPPSVFTRRWQPCVFSRRASDRILAWRLGGSRDFYLLKLTAELQPSGEPQRLTFEERGAPGSAWAADGKSIIYTYGIASYALWRFTLPGSGDIGSPQSLSFAGDGFMPCVSRQGNRLAFTRDVIRRQRLAGSVARAGRQRQRSFQLHRVDSQRLRTAVLAGWKADCVSIDSHGDSGKSGRRTATGRTRFS